MAHESQPIKPPDLSSCKNFFPPTLLPFQVFPNFGPSFVGLFNPKAIVLPDKTHQREAVYESRPVGSMGDWSPASASPTQGPIPLNYTTTTRIRTSQPYRAGKYDDLCWETLIGQVRVYGNG